MKLITTYLDSIHHLLLTLGWWTLLGLAICAILWLLPSRIWKIRNIAVIPLCALCGAALPMCNFAALAPAMFILKKGRASWALGFFCAAITLNPSSLLLARAYMGMKLTVAYGVSAFLLALAAGIAGRRLDTDEESGPGSFLSFASQICLWLCGGIFLQALLQGLYPVTELLADPAGASPFSVAFFTLCRHLCIPDDISVAASLAASGMSPGRVILLLLLGSGSNLPELVCLRQMGGKKIALTYIVILVFYSTLVYLAVQLFMASGFVPQYSLAEAEGYVKLANALSIKTWMPARAFCALILSALALYGLYTKVFSKLSLQGNLKNK